MEPCSVARMRPIRLVCETRYYVGLHR
jgi:hypothetical protein